MHIRVSTQTRIRKSPSESERVESLFDIISLILGRADESVVKLKTKIAVRRQQYWEYYIFIKEIKHKKKFQIQHT